MGGFTGPMASTERVVGDESTRRLVGYAAGLGVNLPAFTIATVKTAFTLFFEHARDPVFSKTHALHTWNERDLLVPLRMFLLGYFKTLIPEETVDLPGTSTGTGRIDFLVGDIAVEVAVRHAGGARAKVLQRENAPEVKKLSRYPGPSVLVLLDFSSDRVPDEELDGYRELPSLGKGNWTKYPFSILYFQGDDGAKRMNIRTA